MEVQLSGATEGGESKNEAQCLYDVLSRKSRVPSFLENAGVVHQKPSRSFSSTFAAELEKARIASAELQDRLNNKLSQVDKMIMMLNQSHKKYSSFFDRREKFLLSMIQR